jgi:hypothetical protein
MHAVHSVQHTVAWLTLQYVDVLFVMLADVQ